MRLSLRDFLALSPGYEVVGEARTDVDAIGAIGTFLAACGASRMIR